MTYTCKGGADPWKNEEQSRLEKMPGELCVRVCEAFDAPAGLRFTSVSLSDRIRKKEGTYSDSSNQYNKWSKSSES